MTRVWRLRPRGEFERIRQNGHAWPHRFFVLIVLPQSDRPTAPPRIGVVAGKKLGGAVTRNRYKRLLRAAVRQAMPDSHQDPPRKTFSRILPPPGGSTEGDQE